MLYFRFGSLPWELSRDSDDKPELLSEMENFLYEINVDRKASDNLMLPVWECQTQVYALLYPEGK